MRFSTEGTDYGIDLSAGNAAELRCCPEAVRTKRVLGLAWGERTGAHECAPAGGPDGDPGSSSHQWGRRQGFTNNASGVSKAKERNSNDG
ncbi:hypothetical protein GCM10009825_37860 [Arthrobacter humicola]|uniref:Uncharacterized protein n=1 Tax=Arthrobacter humicola TaxID=409291 RepID=A0ABN2ZQ16_9MICC